MVRNTFIPASLRRDAATYLSIVKIT